MRGTRPLITVSFAVAVPAAHDTASRGHFSIIHSGGEDRGKPSAGLHTTQALRDRGPLISHIEHNDGSRMDRECHNWVVVHSK